LLVFSFRFRSGASVHGRATKNIELKSNCCSSGQSHTKQKTEADKKKVSKKVMRTFLIQAPLVTCDSCPTFSASLLVCFSTPLALPSTTGHLRQLSHFFSQSPSLFFSTTCLAGNSLRRLSFEALALANLIRHSKNKLHSAQNKFDSAQCKTDRAQHEKTVTNVM
jgi:hypothetical protein